MKKQNFFLIFCIITAHAFGQNGLKRTIISPNLTIDFPGESRAVGTWQPVHQLPNKLIYKCKVWSNKDLSITFIDTAKADELHLTHIYDDFVRELPKEIKGFRLFGAYQKDDYPEFLFVLIYLNPHKPNSSLNIVQSLDGTIWGATYYTDENTNPFQELKLLATKHFKTKALITHGTATIERQN